MAVITNTIRWADNTAQLRANLMQGIGTLDAMKSSVDRTVASLSGQGLFTAANKVAAAIEQMGGVTKLTAAEQERANAVIDKAIEKYRLMGMTVPPALQQISDATKKTSDSWGDFVKGFKVEDAISNPMGVAKQAAFGLAESIGGVALAATAAVASIVAIGGAIFSLASKAAAVGNHLDDMADKTGLSVPALSRLQNAATVAGSDLGTLTDAIFKVQQKMGEGGEHWDAAMKKMGLSTEQLKAAGPDQLLQILTTGLEGISDPAERAAVGVAVMGKSFKDVYPTLTDLNAALLLTNDIEPWTAEQAKEAEHFEMQMKSLKVHVEALGTALGRDLIPSVSTFVGWLVDGSVWLGTWAGRMSGLTGFVLAGADAWRFSAAAIDVFSGKANEQVKITGDAKKGVDGWHASLGKLAITVPTLTEALVTDGLASKDLARTHAELAKAHALAEAAAKRHAEAEAKFKASVEGLSFKTYIADTSKLNAIIPDLSTHVAEMAAKFRMARDQMGDLTSTDISFNKAVLETDAGVRKTVTAFSTLPNVVAQATKQIKAAGDELRISFGERAVGYLDGISHILQNVRGQFAQVASAAVSGAKQIIDSWKNAHDIVGVVIAAITTAVVLIGKLFHDAEEEVNPVRETFVQINGGLKTLNERAHDAGATLTALLNARTPEAYKKAIDDLNAAFKFQDDAMATLDATVAKYGFTIEQLGPKFGQQKLSEGFLKLYQDTKVLAAAGIDLDVIIGKQASSYEDLVLTALKTGQTIPKELEPILKRMAELGLLTDASGNKMEDLGQLTFAETLDKKFTTLIETIQKLADAISRGLGGAINSLPDKKTIEIGVDWDPNQVSVDHPDWQTVRAATGGRITRSGLVPVPQYFAFRGNVLPFPGRPRGSDTQPAWLTPGELVLTPPAALAYEQVMMSTGQGSLPRSADTSGATVPPSTGGGDLRVVLELDGRVITERVIRNVQLNKDGSYTKARGALGLAS